MHVPKAIPTIFVSVTFIAGAHAFATPIHLVKDINTRPTSASGSGPGGFVEVGGVLFFSAYTLETGRELWKTDGTEAGTVLVKDINPGPDNSYPGAFVAVGGTLFFYANDGVHASELWKSDGTEAGTVLVKDINPGPYYSFPTSGVLELTAINGRVVFVANDGVHGDEVWTSDGTEAGTVLLKDIYPGTYGSYASGFTQAGDVLVFRGSDDAHGAELWKTDGTVEGTALLFDFQPGPNSSVPQSFTKVGSLVYFSFSTNYYAGSNLWKTNGTAAGTVPVSGAPQRLCAMTAIELRGGVIFTARTYSSAIQIWRSNGSASTTALLKEFPVLPNMGDVGWIGQLTYLDNDVYFLVGNGDSTSSCGRRTGPRAARSA